MRGFLRIAELYKEVRPALGGEHGAPCRIKALAVIPGAVPVFSPCWAAGRRGSIRLWKRRARSGLRCAGRASCRLPRGPVRRSPPGASRSPRCGGRCENCTTPAGRVGNATAGPADRAGEAEVAELRPHKLVLQVAALVEAEHAAPPPCAARCWASSSRRSSRRRTSVAGWPFWWRTHAADCSIRTSSCWRFSAAPRRTPMFVVDQLHVPQFRVRTISPAWLS
jgi:hypothetical protein